MVSNMCGYCKTNSWFDAMETIEEDVIESISEVENNRLKTEDKGQEYNDNQLIIYKSVVLKFIRILKN